MRKMKFKKRGGEYYRRKAVSFLWKLARLALLIGFAYIILYPLFYLLSSALRPQSEMYDPAVIWIPKSPTLDNMKKAWTYLNYPQALWRTAYLSVGSACLQLVTCSMAGYGLARYRFSARGVIFSLVVLTIIIPMQTIAIPMFLNYRQMGLLDSPLAFFLPSALGMGLRGGLFVFIFRQFFRGMPKELEEAARVDGCGVLSTFVRIIVPNAGGGYLTVFLFSLVWHWNDYYYSAMFFNRNYPLTVLLDNMSRDLKKAATVNGETLDTVTTWLFSGCLLLIIPLLIVFFILQKNFTESVQRSGLVE